MVRRVSLVFRYPIRLPQEDTVNVEDLPEYAKVPEVAKVLGLSEASVWRLVWAGELPSIRLGERSVRVPRAGLADYLARRPAAVT